MSEGRKRPAVPDTFRRSAAVSLVTLIALVGFGTILTAYPMRGLPGFAGRALRALRSGELNREAREAQVAGYYEDLLDEGTRAAGVQSLLLGQLDERAKKEKAFRWEGVSQNKGDRYVKSPGFLIFEHKPGVDVPDAPDLESRHITNGMGLVDQEYTLLKPPRTRRIALLGDSVTVGYGTKFGANYEALLERALNEKHRGAGVDRYEIINFAVGGYRLTQIMDVALERVPSFKPDVVVVALTEQINSERWGAHVAQLYHDGIDLKYDFIRRLVVEAQLERTDSTTVMVSKLSRFRLDMVRYALQQVQSVTVRDGAKLVVLLVPTVRERSVLEDSFAGIRELLESLGIVYADLLDAFDGIDDLEAYRAVEGDVHPNEAGHRLIFESLYRKIVADPKLAAAFTAGDAP